MAKLTAQQKMARYSCFEEARGHLTLCWTDDELENEEAKWVIRFLDRQAQKWFEAAQKHLSSTGQTK